MPVTASTSLTNRTTPGARRTHRKASALHAAERAFQVLAVRPAPLSFDGRSLPGLPDRHLDLLELRGLLVGRRLPPETVDVVWRRLMLQAREWGPAWVVAATGTAAPGLSRMVSRLSVGHRPLAEDIESEVLAGFLHALRHADPAPPRVWLRLAWAAWRAGDRVRRVRDDATLLGDLPAGSRVPRPPYGHPDLLLGRAVAVGVLTAEEAELIGETRLGDVLTEVLADARGVSPQVLRMRRSRAEHRLVAALREGCLSEVVVSASLRRSDAPRRPTVTHREGHHVIDR
jgi:hypothetical protein